MPPVSSPAGSRTALVTWAVVFAILWVTASIFAIYFYASASKVTDQYDTLRKQYIPDIIAESELNSDAVRHMKELRTQEGTGLNPSMSAFSVALAQRDQMAQMVAGAGGKETADKVGKDALDAASKAGKAVNLSVPTTDNLALALTTVANGLTAEKRQA